MDADLDGKDQYIPDNHVENFVSPTSPLQFNTLEEEALRQVDETLGQGVQDSMHAIDPNAMLVSDEPIPSPEPVIDDLEIPSPNTCHQVLVDSCMLTKDDTDQL